MRGIMADEKLTAEQLRTLRDAFDMACSHCAGVVYGVEARAHMPEEWRAQARLLLNEHAERGARIVELERERDHAIKYARCDWCTCPHEHPSLEPGSASEPEP